MVGFEALKIESAVRDRELNNFENFGSKLPPNLKDSGSLITPCTIGTNFLNRALCDIGPNINLSLYLIYKMLGLEDAKPTSVTLQLSLSYPRGIIKDVLVKVDKFIFPADFIIFQEMNSEIPIILGRPFLTAGRTLIDIPKGELTKRVQNQQLTFNVFNVMKFPNESDKFFFISVVDNLAKKVFQANQIKDSLERIWLSCKGEKMKKSKR
ncbi:hypothetical protein CDL12_11331 [Handroanthus impetiginosus]|uniref:Retrovirus-related Pol polyprotein from transposon opus n=1 Tax=Handroanthus impetiginosus TaxID=429701 RepID=A0A2G9HER9_9LAMI|nr:hypothetical protein CDL12_11331 [Handroanthus impetiginosus]